MYEELVERLREVEEMLRTVSFDEAKSLVAQAADAIEERDRYALTIQHEMMAEAESHIALVERLNKRIEELELHYCRHAIHNEHDRGDDSLCEKYKCEVTALPRWIPVTEALPVSVDDDVLVTDGEGYAVGYWRPDAQAWDSTDFGWLENRSEPPCGIHTVTHWMPLPPLPEPQKEETR